MAMDLSEYREYYVNQIKATAIEEERYPYEVFIDQVSDIMISDWGLLSTIDNCQFSEPRGTRAFKSMLIHAGSLEIPTNTVNLLFADFSDESLTTITNTDIKTHSDQMVNFFENAMKGYFSDGEQSNPAVQLALEIKRKASEIYKLNLFFISTNQLSRRVKNIDLDDVEIQGRIYKVELDVIDIDKIYNAQLATSQKEDTVISVTDFGIRGIPCIRADVGAGRYEAYLAVVPGEFLSDVFKKYGPRLLERNVRSFLQLRGGVNKGIRGTILNERENFFSYNNGISATAKSIKITNAPANGQNIVAFTDFQIINGGQTTASLASASIKDGAPLDGIYVQMKLIVIKEEGTEGDEFVRKTSQYANSQNKVTAADLVSNHPYYQRIEDFSRKLFAPPSKGLPYQTIWFFERSRGQYEQPKMKMKPAERAVYERINPTNQRFDKKDLAKYLNAADMYPYHVAWGGEVNSQRFQAKIEELWKIDPAVFNESYFRDAIAKAIMFISSRKAVLSQVWYKESGGYLIQTVTYTISKLLFEVRKLGMFINYRNIWDKQEIPDFLLDDILLIAQLVRKVLFCPGLGNIETYCKKPECWETIKEYPFELSVSTKSYLINEEDIRDEKVTAKKEQKFTDKLSTEVDVFNYGEVYWRNLCSRGKEQKLLNSNEVQLLDLAAEYCSGARGLPQFYFKRIMAVREKLGLAQIHI